MVEGRLRVQMLGTLRAWRGEREVDLGSPQGQAVAAVLALRPGRVVPVDDLVDGVFGATLPGHPKQGIQTHVSRLRRALGADAISTVAGGDGYLLHLAAEDLDVWHCERLLDAAREHAARGRTGRAVDSYAEALRLLDAAPLAGVPGPAADVTRLRLAEQRLAAQEDWFDQRLRLGRHAAVAAELAALIEAHPLRERLHQLLMLARYRCGRQAEALAVHADLRARLREELGITPSAETDAMLQGILRHDPALIAAAQPTPAAPGPTAPGRIPSELPPAVPRQLPAVGATFVGRAAQLAALSVALTPGSGEERSGAPLLAVVTGMGGVGKTMLAVRAAHTAARHYPDGQLHLDLRGTGDTPMDAADALTTVLRTFEVTVPPEAGLGELSALYRTATAGRRFLLLLDNAADAAQVAALVPGTGGCAVLVTSRRALPELAADHAVELEVFTEAEAVALLGAVVGPTRIDADPAAVREIARYCGGLPLALRIVGARLAGRPTWTARTVVGRLADERVRLGELRAGTLAVGPVFELGYAQLDPVQSRAFRLLGAIGIPDLSLPAVAAVLRLPVAEADEVLESLVDAGMLQSPRPGRYRLHDLLCLFARARAEEAADTGTAVANLLGFFVATLRECRRFEESVKGFSYLSALRVQEGVPGLRLGAGEEASAWVVEELPAAAALLDRIAQRGTGQAASAQAGPRPCGAMTVPADAETELFDLAADCLLGLAAVAPVNSRRELFVIAARLSKAAAGRPARARIDLAHLQLLTVAGQLGRVAALLPGTAAPTGGDEVLTLAWLGIVRDYEFWQGRFAAALTAAQAECALAERLGERMQAATARFRASRFQSALGDPDAALATWRAAYDAGPEAEQNVYGVVALGMALLGQGRHEAAADTFRQLAQRMREVGAADEVQSAVRAEAECLRRAGRGPEALELVERSLAAAEELGDDLDQARALAVRGLVLADLGRAAEARECEQRAAELMTAMGLPADIPALYVA